MDFDNPNYFNVQKDESHRIQRKNSAGLGRSDSLLTGSECAGSSNKNRIHFYRSVSSNSADSNKELLIMGEPRLNDVAPDLAVAKCHHLSRGSNSLTRIVINNNNLIQYAALPTSDKFLDALLQEDDKISRENENETGEVFVNGDSAMQSNFGSNKMMFIHEPSRRHSLGTLPIIANSNSATVTTAVASRHRTKSMAVENCSSSSFKEDMLQVVKESDVAITPSIDEHSLRHISYPRKRCLKCSKGALSKQHINMDDIIIVSLQSSDPANLWVTYFTLYFQQISKSAYRQPFKIQHVFLEDTVNFKLLDRKFADGTTGVKLQLVIVCPNFLEFAMVHPTEINSFSKLLLPDRTLALLLGVTDDDLTDIHKNALPSYFQWQRQSVGQDQDKNFAKDFLAQAMTIFSKILKQQSAYIAQEKSCFSVQPKKIRQGQTSVFIILNYPLQKEDSIKISVERNGELYEIKAMKRRNPYTIKIKVPENFTDASAIVNILMEKNGSIIGSRPIKCESKLRELEQILRSIDSPIDFMCKSLSFNPADRENLDNWLVHNFKKKLPPHFNLLGTQNIPFAASTFQNHKQSNQEFPTLLHFAAKFGLEKFAIHLLECPGADIAYDVKNVYDMTPPEIAEASGHKELSNILRGYMKMNEVSTVYEKLKEISLQQKKIDDDEERYLKPKEVVEQFYKICPPPRPIKSELEHNHPLNAALPTTCLSDCSNSMYLPMDRKAKTPSIEDIHQSLIDSLSLHIPNQQFPRTMDLSASIPSYSTTNRPEIKLNVIEDKVQKELAEIIMDFKNNVHSLAQVEKLVEDWKNRNDVQKSFEEKQQQLLEMRTRYEKIQQEIKITTKKPSSFDRIRRLFTRYQKPATTISSDELKLEDEIITTATSIISSGPAMIPNQGSRPISSLSTSSSASSGRMSTISGCSIGDSGTHSDNEDRKLILCNSNDNNFSKTILDFNYAPVPAPKPVKFAIMQYFETIDENKPINRANTFSIKINDRCDAKLNEQFYIQFPPNGQPVTGLNENNSIDNLNFVNREESHINVPVSLPSNLEMPPHENINFKIPTST